MFISLCLIRWIQMNCFFPLRPKVFFLQQRIFLENSGVSHAYQMNVSSQHLLLSPFFSNDMLLGSNFWTLLQLWKEGKKEKSRKEIKIKGRRKQNQSGSITIAWPVKVTAWPMTAVLVATKKSNFASILPILEYYMFLCMGYLLNVHTSPVHAKETTSGYYNGKHRRELFN